MTPPFARPRFAASSPRVHAQIEADSVEKSTRPHYNSFCNTPAGRRRAFIRKKKWDVFLATERLADRPVLSEEYIDSLWSNWGQLAAIAASPASLHSHFIFNNLQLCEEVVFQVSWGATFHFANFLSLVVVDAAARLHRPRIPNIPRYLGWSQFLQFEVLRPGVRSQPCWFRE